MELTKEEAKFVIDNRIRLSWKEIWGRFKEAFLKSWRFRIWVISKTICIISVGLIIFGVVTLTSDLISVEKEIPVSGEHIISIDSGSVYIDDELVTGFEEIPWQLNMLPFACIAFVITGGFLLINWIVSAKKPISVTKIIGKKSSVEIATEHWEQLGELPPSPPPRKGRVSNL